MTTHFYGSIDPITKLFAHFFQHSLSSDAPSNCKIVYLCGNAIQQMRDTLSPYQLPCFTPAMWSEHAVVSTNDKCERLWWTANKVGTMFSLLLSIFLFRMWFISYWSVSPSPWLCRCRLLLVRRYETWLCLCACVRRFQIQFSHINDSHKQIVFHLSNSTSSLEWAFSRSGLVDGPTARGTGTGGGGEATATHKLKIELSAQRGDINENINDGIEFECQQIHKNWCKRQTELHIFRFVNSLVAFAVCVCARVLLNFLWNFCYSIRKQSFVTQCSQRRYTCHIHISLIPDTVWKPLAFGFLSNSIFFYFHDCGMQKCVLIQSSERVAYESCGCLVPAELYDCWNTLQTQRR